MFDYIRGKLVRVEKDAVVLENNGIGYRLAVPGASLHRLGEAGTDTRLYTYLAVKEDDISLYGFTDVSERECFLLLLSVSGVGPRGALSVLSALGAEEFYLAVLREDEKILTRAPGIGSKSAKRLIVELKDKVTRLGRPAGYDLPPGDGFAEALEALLSLGYSAAEARGALLPAQNSAEKQAAGGELLRLALSRLGAK
jgi:Holliday junction DNA helicase RuvA